MNSFSSSPSSLFKRFTMPEKLVKAIAMVSKTKLAPAAAAVPIPLPPARRQSTTSSSVSPAPPPPSSPPPPPPPPSTHQSQTAAVTACIVRAAAATAAAAAAVSTFYEALQHNAEKQRLFASQILIVYARSKKQNRKSSKKQQKHSLVIFDKDGTLICFNSMWVPWAKTVVSTLGQITGIGNIGNDICQLLGFCPIHEQVKHGLLAHGTMGQIRDSIVAVLVQKGVAKQRALQMVKNAVPEGDTSGTLRQITDLQMLFTTLRDNQIKVAICTSDSRAATLSTLRHLGLEQLVDFVMCGDDEQSVPKPSPHNALHICRELGVQPEEALMVGDTIVDMTMGRAARLGATVGVLSGIGNHEELQPEADHIINDVGDLLPLVLWEKSAEMMPAMILDAEQQQQKEQKLHNNNNVRAICNH